MSTIPYTCTNKAKFLFYIMIMVLGLLRLTIIVQIKIYSLEDYEVYLLPTLFYYSLLFAIITGLFFGYKFFYTTYDDDKIVYHNVLFKKTATIHFQQIKYALFSKRGIYLYKTSSPVKGSKADMFIPFFRLGLIQAIPVNDFFETLIEKRHIAIKKTFKVLPGYTKSWNLVSMGYALLTICMLIICLEPLYTVIVLYQSFS